MTEYEDAYYILFRGITDALAEIEEQNYRNAKKIILQAQKDGEECSDLSL